jgi:hypothetical protein
VWIRETPIACHRKPCIARSAAVIDVDRAEILRT